MALFRTAPLIAPEPPNLPLAPKQYSPDDQEKFSNVLRLYFNRLKNFNQLFTTDTGGAFLKFPHISASSSLVQYATATNTPTKVGWTTLNSNNGFTLDPSGYATTSIPGVYKIDYGLQLSNNDNAIHFVWVWLRINGDDIENSSVKFTLPARKSAGVPFEVLAYSNIVYSVLADDQVELWWATSQAATSGGGVGIYLKAEPAASSPFALPATPSAIGSITFVSALLT